MPVIGLIPVMGADALSVTLVLIVKLALKLAAGTKLTPASSVLTSAIAPEALHTPVPAV
jgi:hypothetical protein